MDDSQIDAMNERALESLDQREPDDDYSPGFRWNGDHHEIEEEEDAEPLDG